MAARPFAFLRGDPSKSARSVLLPKPSCVSPHGRAPLEENGNGRAMPFFEHAAKGRDGSPSGAGAMERPWKRDPLTGTSSAVKMGRQKGHGSSRGPRWRLICRSRDARSTPRWQRFLIWRQEAPRCDLCGLRAILRSQEGRSLRATSAIRAIFVLFFPSLHGAGRRLLRRCRHRKVHAVESRSPRYAHLKKGTLVILKRSRRGYLADVILLFRPLRSACLR